MGNETKMYNNFSTDCSQFIHPHQSDVDVAILRNLKRRPVTMQNIKQNYD
jgi:hypothetical protein